MDTALVPAEMMKAYRSKLDREISLIARSKTMKQIAETLPELGKSDGLLVILGPAGSGRKTFAKAVHLSSAMWWRPFIEADLTGVDIENAKKILFGFKEGHLFVADEKLPGLFDMAAESTLCFRNFDRYAKEVQEDISVAVKAGEFTPIGSKKRTRLTSRIIVTISNKPSELLKSGLIEEGVHALIDTNTVVIPPLSKRRDDIMPLAERFVRDAAEQFGVTLKKFSKEADRWLKKAPWNGNITQLKKSVYLACFNTTDVVLFPNHFALAHDGNIDAYQEKQLDELSIQALIEMKLKSFLGRLGNFEASDVHEAIMGRVEEPLIKMVLGFAKGNQIKASRMLGINRNTLRSKITKYSINAKALYVMKDTVRSGN